MTIKSTLKSGTQNLKRCKLEQDKDYASPVIQKKQKLNSDFYSAGEIEDLEIISVCGIVAVVVNFTPIQLLPWADTIEQSDFHTAMEEAGSCADHCQDQCPLFASNIWAKRTIGHKHDIVKMQ
ncbi:hypothetical protein TSUD_347390 [Trifolium subterraneum]|nr:hypothetical protein TSUD_347390 [Trifolium subterraneum]